MSSRSKISNPPKQEQVIGAPELKKDFVRCRHSHFQECPRGWGGKGNQIGLQVPSGPQNTQVIFFWGVAELSLKHKNPPRMQELQDSKGIDKSKC